MALAADPPRLLRVVGHALSLLLVGTLGALIWGHMGGASRGLSLNHSYITEYGFGAPNWPWIIVATFGFASVLFLLAVGFLLRPERRVLVPIGCALLAGSAMTLFFVSYAPVRRVEQSSTATHAWWGPRWWFESRTSQTDYEDGMADAYSDVHYHAIRLFVINGLLGQALIAAGLYGLRPWRCFAITTIVAVAAMSVLFLLGDQTKEYHGLWQRLGLSLMYLWLWNARLRLTTDTLLHIQQDCIGYPQLTKNDKSMPHADFPA